MAQELERIYDPGRRTIIVKLLDDFGVEQSLQIFVGQDKCLACGTPMPGDQTIDVEDVIQRTIDSLDTETAKVQSHFSTSQKSNQS